MDHTVAWEFLSLLHTSITSNTQRSPTRFAHLSKRNVWKHLAKIAPKQTPAGRRAPSWLLHDSPETPTTRKPCVRPHRTMEWFHAPVQSPATRSASTPPMRASRARSSRSTTPNTSFRTAAPRGPPTTPADDQSSPSHRRPPPSERSWVESLPFWKVADHLELHAERLRQRDNERLRSFLQEKDEHQHKTVKKELTQHEKEYIAAQKEYKARQEKERLASKQAERERVERRGDAMRAEQQLQMAIASPHASPFFFRPGARPGAESFKKAPQDIS